MKLQHFIVLGGFSGMATSMVAPFTNTGYLERIDSGDESRRSQ